MFGFFKRKSNDEKDDTQPLVESSEQAINTPSTDEAATTAESTSHIAEQIPAVVEPEQIPAVVEPEQIPDIVESESIAEPIKVEPPITAKQPVESPEPTSQQIAEPEEIVEVSSVDDVVTDKPDKKSWFARLKTGLSKTRSSFTEGITDIVLGKKEIDDDLLEELEMQLLVADVGVEATQQIISNLTAKVSRKELNDSDALYDALKTELRSLLGNSKPLEIENNRNSPYVILMVGINGAGKTTTIGKLAKRLQLEGKSVMLAAGDTFRAAAVEQLQEWGRRNEIPVIAQHSGADSASVIYDAVEAAKSRGIDVLIADTAGRLHTQSNLMEELKKIKRVMGKLDLGAPHEVMLVVDGGTGQNALQQAEHFDKTVGLTGITISKLDGTAKGGVIFAIAKKFGFPIRFIGVGEGIDDLRVFDADDYVNALLDKNEP